MSLFIGVDFSGAARPWKPQLTKPTVWVAWVRREERRWALERLVSVQDLAGNGTPFQRLTRLLADAEFEAAAIDAPFSLPMAHLPAGKHSELLRQVSRLPNAIDRPFPKGTAIRDLAETVSILKEKKPLRETEKEWIRRGVNTRSTLWCGPRGGAPFVAACLRLIEQSNRPCWPWHRFQKGILAEAFPAAQLYEWQLPFRRYTSQNGDDRRARKRILDYLSTRLDIDSQHIEVMEESADALDAVIASFAAIAIAESNSIDTALSEEGAIAIERRR